MQQFNIPIFVAWRIRGDKQLATSVVIKKYRIMQMLSDGSVITPTYNDDGNEFDLFDDDYASEQEALDAISEKTKQHGAWLLQYKSYVIISLFVVTPSEDVLPDAELVSSTIEHE